MYLCFVFAFSMVTAVVESRHDASNQARKTKQKRLGNSRQYKQDNNDITTIVFKTDGNDRILRREAGMLTSLPSQFADFGLAALSHRKTA